MNKRPDKAEFEEVATAMSIDPAFVEKDWIVTQVLEIIGRISHKDCSIVFSGGTALSKAHKLLERFSEDIDFRIITSEKMSQGDLRKYKYEIVGALQKAGFVIDKENIRTRNGGNFFAIDLNYETAFPRANALRPHVLVEMTVMNIHLPAIEKPVSSLLNEYAKREPEIAKISCIDPVENAADKLSAISWRIPDRDRGSDNDDPSVVRHIHDLALLKAGAMAFPEFKKLVETSMQQDGRRAKTDTGLNEMLRDEKLANTIKVIEGDIVAYKNEYDRFVRGVSYAKDGNFPSFEAAMNSLHELIVYIKD